MTIRSWCAAMLSVTLAAAALVLAAPLAGAATAPSLSLSSRILSGDGSHVVTVTGRNYLVPPHAEGASVFGGVYLFFGWVKPGNAWGPSHRGSGDAGTFGATYVYPGTEGDAGTRDPGSGGIRFISFTPGGTSGAATDEHMDDTGGWKVRLTIPGPTFSYQDPSGVSRTVDCRKVVCGVYTIGAHGKPSATNEVFTPVSFRTVATPTPTRPMTAPRPAPTASSSTERSSTSSATTATGTGAPPTATVARSRTAAAVGPAVSDTFTPSSDRVTPLSVGANTAPPGSNSWLVAAATVALMLGAAVALAHRPRSRRRGRGTHST